MNLRHMSLLFATCVTLFDADQSLGQHFDIFLARPTLGTKSVIGGADVDALAYDDTTRVFEAELDDALGEFFALEPGVNHPNIDDPALASYPASASPLPAGDTLRLIKRTFTVAGATGDLFYWNGLGAVSFVAAAADFRLDGADPLGSIAGVGGVFDDHPFLVIDDDSLPGVYLASVRGIVDGYDPSDPVFLVLGTHSLITPQFLGISKTEFDLLSDDELDEALDAVIDPAADYVSANLAVPEANSIALLVLAFGFACYFRKR